MADPNRDEIARLELLHRAHPDGLVFPYLAEAYRKSGQLDRAEDLLLQGLSRHEDHSSAHVVLGRVRLDKGRSEEAGTAFRRVLQLDPNNAIAIRALADLAAAQGDVQEAVSYYRRLQKLHPRDEEIAERIDELKAGRTPPPRQPPTEPEPAEAEPRLTLEEWDPEGGKSGRRTVKHGPATPYAPQPEEPGEVFTETMAELYTRQGFYDRAVRVYRRLLSLHPGEPRLTSKLAEVEELRREARSRRESAPAPSDGDGSQGLERTSPVEADAAAREPASSAEPVTAEAAAVVESPPVGAYLGSLLAWRPGTGHAAEVEEPAGMEEEAEAGAEAPGAAGAPEARGPAEEPAGAREEAETAEPGASASDVAAADDGSDASWPWEEPVVPAEEAGEPEPEVGAGPEAGEEPADAEPSVSEPERPARSEAESAMEPSRPATAPEAAARPRPAAAPAMRTEAGAARLQAAPEAILALTDLLVGLLEYRDPFFRGSSSLTRLLAAAVAREMGLADAEVNNLQLAAVLRDLGRLALGGKLVSGSPGKTPEVRRRIERHVDLALHLMEGIDLPASVRYAVRHHHERWDGRGYPDGLAGAEIPLPARILAVVDSFAAMVAARPYRLPRKVPEAASELRTEAGTRYDPDVVDALLRVLARRDQPHLGFVLRHHILIVSPDQPGATVTAAKLCSSGYLAEVAPDVESARERLRRVPVAAVVVGAELGNGQASSFIREMRVDPMLAQLPVVVVDAPEVDKRVELLENGADVCFAPDAAYSELQGTLGALIRRAFRQRPESAEGDGEEAPWLALQGDIQDFPLTWLLQVMKYDSRTAAIGIRTATDMGVIYLEDGDARHAQIRGGEKGEAALRVMLGWRKGRFTVDAEARPSERTITKPITHLLLDEAVAEDHAAAGQIFGAVRPDS